VVKATDMRPASLGSTPAGTHMMAAGRAKTAPLPVSPTLAGT